MATMLVTGRALASARPRLEAGTSPRGAAVRAGEQQCCGFEDTTYMKAAQGGHLAVLQWMRANGGEWNEYTCWCAAHSGYLEVLQWVVANGCPWDRADCLRISDVAVREWIQEQADEEA